MFLECSYTAVGTHRGGGGGRVRIPVELWERWAVHTCAGMGGVGSKPPDDPGKPPATALAGAANCTASDSFGIVPD